jgi:hypothetical protein
VVVMMAPAVRVPAVMPVVRGSRATGLGLRIRFDLGGSLCGCRMLRGKQQRSCFKEQYS